MTNWDKFLVNSSAELEEEGVSPEEEKLYNLTGSYKGHSVDVVGGIHGWSGMFRVERVTEQFHTRGAARDALIHYLKDLFERE